MNHPLCLMLPLLALSFSACQESSQPRESTRREQGAGPVRVYVGTYTNAKSKGIYVMEMDPKTGALTEPRLAAETKSPSFLALDHDHTHLYAVGETDTFDGQPYGSVAAFAINDDGSLRKLNEQPAAGTGPCHLVYDAPTRTILVANYGSGSTSMLPVKDDGSLGPPSAVVEHKGSSVNKQRQQGPHAHCVMVAPRSKQFQGNRVYVADLGLDKVLVYEFDRESGFRPAIPASASVSPGGGPRHTAFGRHDVVYVNNEMTSTVTAFSHDPKTGAMREIQTVTTLPPDTDKSKNSTAEIAVHPSGKFVYVSNRGHNSVAIFKVDSDTGKLTAAGHQSTQGKTPRNFAIAPGGQFLLAANQGTDNVVVFRIDQETGALAPTGATATVPTPVCITFVP